MESSTSTSTWLPWEYPYFQQQAGWQDEDFYNSPCFAVKAEVGLFQAIHGMTIRDGIAELLFGTKSNQIMYCDFKTLILKCIDGPKETHQGFRCDMLAALISEDRDLCWQLFENNVTLLPVVVSSLPKVNRQDEEADDIYQEYIYRGRPQSPDVIRKKLAPEEITKRWIDNTIVCLVNELLGVHALSRMCRSLLTIICNFACGT